MRNEKNAFISGQIENMTKNLNTGAILTAALAKSMENPIDCTLADLYDIEFIAEALRRTIESPDVSRAIKNLIETAILDPEEMAVAGIITPENGIEKASKEANQ